MPSPLLLIVAGPNGSGTTTLVRQGVLAAHLDVPLGSINPDDVARDLAGGGAPTADISLRAAQIWTSQAESTRLGKVEKSP